MIGPNTPLTFSPDPNEMVSPEQIDGWLNEVTGERVYPRTGLGAVYCLWGRAYGLRPEILVAQGAQECYFYREHDNPHWMAYNNPAGMKYYRDRFDPLDAPPELNRQGGWAVFMTKRQGVKAHVELALRYVEAGANTVSKFLTRWGTGQVSRVVERANAILGYGRLPPPGVRGEFTGQAVSELMSRGVMRGYPGGYVRQEWPLTRAEMATLLARTFWQKLTGVAPAPPPPDVQNHWAKDSICKVVGVGWMVGYPDGNWYPDLPLTRAQTCMILYRVGAPAATEQPAPTFVDVPPDAWHYNAVMWAYTQGWLQEFTEADYFGQARFLPDYPITRAEMSILLYNLMSVMGMLSGVGAVGGGSRLVPAAWVAAEDRWVPKWAVPAFAGREETFEMPFTLVPAERVSGTGNTLARRPWILIASGAAAVAGLAWLATRR